MNLIHVVAWLAVALQAPAPSPATQTPVASKPPAQQPPAPAQADRLDSIDAEERLRAVRALAESQRDEAWPKIVSALIDADARVADGAQIALARANSDAALEVLLGTHGLSSPDEAVRLRVAEALGRLARVPDAKALIQHLADPSDPVRRTLCWSIERWAKRKLLDDEARALLAPQFVKLLQHDRASGVRAAALMTLHALMPKDSRSFETAAIQDRDWMVRAASWMLRAREATPDDASRLAKLAFADASPSVRASAIEWLAALPPGSDRILPGARALVDELAIETEARLQRDAYESLVRISGLSVPPTSKVWSSWAAIPRPCDPNAPNAAGAEREAPAPELFGLALHSRRIAFLVDLSDEMWGAASGGGSRKAAVDREFARALRTLAPETEFNLTPYALEPTAWKKSVARASSENVDAASSFLESSSRRGAADFWRAAMNAFEDPKVDTLVVVTHGAIQGARHSNLVLVRTLFTEFNRFRRVELDAVLIDADDATAALWSNLCSDNRGRALRITL